MRQIANQKKKFDRVIAAVLASLMIAVCSAGMVAAVGQIAYAADTMAAKSAAHAAKIAAAGKPARVTGLKAAAAGNNYVKLSWARASGATKYQVYRSANRKTGYKKIATVSGLTYKSAGLKLGSTYYFKVRALKGKKAGAYSAVVSGKTRLVSPEVSARSTSRGPVLTWKAVPGATGYTIYVMRSTAISGDPLEAAGSGGALQVNSGNDANGSNWTLLANTSNCRYTDRTLSEVGSERSYRVTAYASVRDKTYYWNSKSKKWVTKKPAARYYKACTRKGDPHKDSKTYSTYKKVVSDAGDPVTARLLDPSEDPGSENRIPNEGYAGEHGRLSVNGTQLIDAYGEQVQLRGLSTHGIAWFPGYVSRETFKWLRDDWNVNCIRLAMYTEEYGGYCSSNNGQGSTAKNQAYLRKLVRSGIDYATELGMYVIIDWHILSDGDPNTHKADAVKFFSEMSDLYADQCNVLYEICNEPNGSTSWSDVKKYADYVIPVIRANDPDAVILVGSPTWSQDIDKALASPLKYDNVMYTLHFYADTHRDDLRQRMEKCIREGLPVFVSEFGTCDAGGSGSMNKTQANKWKDLIEKYNVSYMCWNLSNKNETSSVLRSSVSDSKVSGWSESQLSEQGKWIRSWMRSEK